MSDSKDWKRLDVPGTWLIDGKGGRLPKRVLIIGEIGDKYLLQAVDNICFADGHGLLMRGERCYATKSSVTIG